MPDDAYAELCRQSDESRFTLALLCDVTDVLARHGYPLPRRGQLLGLVQSLYTHLHRDGWTWYDR